MSGIENEAVKSVFDNFPPKARKKLLSLRRLILTTASKIPETGEIEETLKWGEPAYLTSQSKSGTTIRIGWKPSAPDQYAMYLNCRTSLVDTYRTIHPELTYDGNRAIIFGLDDKVPTQALAHCIKMALTYHGTRRRKRSA